MTEKFKRWDVIDHLNSDDEILAYLEGCCEEDPGDGSLIRAALGDVAKAKGMSQLAGQTGIDRSALYRALSPEGNPEFTTILKVTRALGLNFCVTKAHPQMAVG